MKKLSPLSMIGSMVKMMNDSRWYTVLDDRELEYEKQFSESEEEEYRPWDTTQELPTGVSSISYKKHVKKTGTCDDIDDEKRVLAIASKMVGKSNYDNNLGRTKMETPPLYSSASYEEALDEYVEIMAERYQETLDETLNHIEEACNQLEFETNDQDVKRAVSEAREGTKNLREDLQKLKGDHG